MGRKPAKPKGKITTKRVQAAENKPPPIPPGAFVPQPEVDEGPFDADGLSVRQRRFAEAIVGPASGNASKAAEMAGYASDNRVALGVTAHRLLNNAKVAEYVAHLLAKQRMTPEWAKASLVDLASASMANFVSIDDNGNPRLDFRKAAAMGALGQIKEYTEDGIDGGDGAGPSVIKRKIKLHDRNAAVMNLLKLFGLVSDRHEFTGEVAIKGYGNVSPDVWPANPPADPVPASPGHPGQPAGGKVDRDV